MRKKISIYFCIIVLLCFVGILSFYLLSNNNTLNAASVPVNTIGIPYAYTEAEVDAYTDSDFLLNPTSSEIGMTINDYKDSLHSSNLLVSNTRDAVVGTFSGDDPIVKIIPRQFFEHVGTYLHIGREYGIFVNTQSLSSNANVSTAFVFDITKYPVNNNNYPSQYVITIEPTFQYGYYYLTSNDNFSTGRNELIYQKSFGRIESVVVPVPGIAYDEFGFVYYFWGENTVYSLKDVSFGLSLFNEQELNIGDSGYNGNNDNGSFITRTNISYYGEGNDDYLTDNMICTVKFALGFVPYLGTAISILDYGVEMIQNTLDDYSVNNDSANLYNTQYYNSKYEQLANYSNLNKSALIELLSQDQKPLLFGRRQQQSYVSGVFTLGMTDNWYTRVIDTIKLSVVSVHTNIFNNSTILSRTTGERSTSNNIRAIQTHNAFLEVPETFYMLPAGVASFSFVAPYKSKYKFTITNASQMVIKINGANVSFSSNIANVIFSSGEKIIQITGENLNKLTSSITIEPDTVDTSVSSKSLSIQNGENYLLKLTSTNVLRTLSTGNIGFQITNIYCDNNWTPYTTYGTFPVSAKIDVPFVAGTYYIIIRNVSSLSSTASLTFSAPPNLNIDTAKSIDVNQTSYTYIRFNARVAGTFNIASTNSAGLQFSVFTSDMQYAQGRNYPGYFYEIEMPANATYYIGIKNSSGTTNTITIHLTGNDFYQLVITNSIFGDVVPDGINYALIRGYTYTLKLYANGVEITNGTNAGNSVFGYLNQDTAYGLYDYINPYNNQTKFNADSPLGGNGVLIAIYMINSIGYMDLIKIYKIIPKFEDSAEITGFINNEDLSLSYSVPRFVSKFEYKIYPYTNIFTVNIDINRAVTETIILGTASFLNNYNLLNCTSVANLRIDIIAIYYLDAFQIQRKVDKIIQGTLSFNSLYASGTGTSANPYLISSIRHLNNLKYYTGNIGIGIYYRQTTDLTFPNIAPSSAYTSSTDLNGIEFYGTYDGNNYTIYNLRYYILATPQHIEIGGLFGSNFGTIINLGIYNLQIDSEVPSHINETSIAVGGVVGTNFGLISHVNVYGNSSIIVNRMNAWTGGIVGCNEAVDRFFIRINYQGVERNYNIAYSNAGVVGEGGLVVYSNGHVGGIVGMNSGNLFSCNNLSESTVELYQIDANNRGAGGIVGYNGYGIIAQCNNYSTIAFVNPSTANNNNITPYMGKIVGLNYGSYNIINSYCYGTLDYGSLQLETNVFGTIILNQRIYVGAYNNQGIGKNNDY
ncbi:MAG: hypothetical protein LBV51_02425 [Acholeplasmatales bacterium]|jgi:hypothetical protein|nr:hypothetical protein [Acholeplasmatales bacterium]